MNQIFSLEGPLFGILSKIFDMLFISILWVLFSLPLITSGAASSALYHTTHKIIFKNEGYIFSTFFNSFRTNLKQGILLTLFCVPVSVFTALCCFFAGSLEKGNFLAYLYASAAILSALFLLVMLTYMFPVLSRFYMKTGDILKTSGALAVTRPGFTLILFFIFLLCALCMFLIPVTCFFLPACYAAASYRLLEPAFQKAAELAKAGSLDDTHDAG